MASKRPFSEEDFSCPICCDIFKDPVLLRCGHSVCRNCIQQYWTAKGSTACPMCRKRSSGIPTVNLALKNLCQTFLDSLGPLEELCEIHQEKLCLYCLDDEQLVCVVCREAREHKAHTCRPVNELAEEWKVVFQQEMNLLSIKMKRIEYAKFIYHQQEVHICHQFKHTENVIRKDFKHLQQLLYNEEKAILTRLNNEKKMKMKLMKDNIQRMTNEISTLSSTVTIMRSYLGEGDIKFLQKYEDMVKRVQDMQQEPDLGQEKLFDTAQYIGNLKFNVWSKIKQSISYSPVVLDPNTANRQLLLSEDLTSFRVKDEEEEDVEGTEKKNLPANPERFVSFPCVLGSVGYSSGTHIWDVDVGDSTFWMVGVTLESVLKERISSFPSDVWCVSYDNDTLILRAPGESPNPLLGSDRPQQVRVKLDLDRRQLSFSDPFDNTVYHIFTTSFTEKVFPFFCSQPSVSPLRIVPVAEPCY